MRVEEKFSLWLLTVAIPCVGALLGTVISFSAGGTPMQGLGWGLLAGVAGDGIYVPLLVYVILPRYPTEVTATPEATPTSHATTAAPKTATKVKDKTEEKKHADLDAERDQRLKELKAAAEDQDNPLDEITVGAQEREIEADYRRKIAERLS